MTKLQIALDDISMQEALSLLEKVQNYVDIVEIGTPFIMEYGMHAVRTVKQTFPQLEVLCDGKIMDAGTLEAETAFQAGADYVTVLGVTDNLTIAEVVEVARRMQKKVMVDMICVADLQNRLKTMEDLGVDVIAVHTGVDQQKQGRTPLDDLREMRAQVSHTPLAVAGGVNAASLPAYLAYDPHIVIIGGGIAHATDPVAAAKQLKEILDQHNKEA